MAAIVLLLIGVMSSCGGPCGKEGYLIYPYLDLDAPGGRGSYYALSETTPR